MTTIVALQHDWGVEFGSDSLVTANRKYSDVRMTKINKRGQFIIAGSGLSSYCDVAQHIWNPPAPSAADKKDLYHFMIAKVIPSLKQEFKDNDLEIKSDKDDEPRFAFLIAICGEVFDVADDFAISLTDSGLYGVGSGSSFALGALAAGASVEKALEIAADFDPYSAHPFAFIEQEKPHSPRS